MRSRHRGCATCYATTSTELKLLLLRLVGLNAGRSVLVRGTTTAAELFEIHPPFATPPSRAGCVFWFPRFGISVGSRDALGEAGRLNRLVVAAGVFAAEAAATVPRAVVPFASRGTLLGAWPFGCALVVRVVAIDVAERIAVPGLRLFAAAAAVERVTRVGRCSDAVTREPSGRDVGLGRIGRLAAGATPSAGSTSWSSSASSSSESSTVELRLPAGVLRGCPGGDMALARAAAIAI